MRDYAGLEALLLDDLALTKDAAEDPHCCSDYSPDYVARVRLAASFYKKLCPGGNSRSADDAALKKFQSVNSSLPEGPWSFCRSNEAQSCFQDYFRDNLRKSLEPRDDFVFDIHFIRENMGVGPGAAQKADSRCLYTKLFESELTYTSDFLVRWYRSALAETGFWADAEMHRFESYGLTRVPGGKIFFAAKNAEISRTCCTEPNLNMLIQKAADAFICRALARDFGIHLDRQPDYNRELARRGSIDQSFGTIDLISASDCMGLHLLQRDLPSGAFKAALFESSCRSAVLPDGSEVKLNMISTMGNGFTFSLQTLIFACAVRAAYSCMGFPCTDPSREYGVFGDDIVVRRETYDFVAECLTSLGFQVNMAKSFNAGPFRESCGYDYFAGVNVRGVYVKSLESPQQVYSLINRLNRWSAYHGIPLTKTVRHLMSWVRDIRVPSSESDDAGVHVPFKLTKPSVTNNYWFKYRCYRRKMQRQVLADVDEDAAGFASMNSSGVAVAFLSGSIRRRDPSPNFNQDDSVYLDPIRYPIRDKPGARARYKVVTQEIPWWDYVPAPDTKTWFGGCLTNPMERHAGNGVRRDVWEDVVLACYLLQIAER